MSGYGEEWLENTDTTFTDMPIEPVEMDNSGLLEIYRKMMLIDLFQTIGVRGVFLQEGGYFPA